MENKHIYKGRALNRSQVAPAGTLPMPALADPQEPAPCESSPPAGSPVGCRTHGGRGAGAASRTLAGLRQGTPLGRRISISCF